MDTETEPASTKSEEIITQAKEIIKGRGTGRFFKYTTIDTLDELLKGKEVTFDGHKEFLTVIGKKFNPYKLPAENVIAHCLLIIIDERLENLETPNFDVEQALDEDPENTPKTWGIVQTAEALLIQKNPQFQGLKQAITEACDQQSTQPTMEYLKKIGGDPLMIQLRKEGHGVEPVGSFSDLIPLSAGAPLGVVTGNQMVTLELDFNNEALIIPPDDIAHEHEVMVREISLDNLRGVYGENDRKELWQNLTDRYPEYFKDKGLSALSSFAQNKPLDQLLRDLKATD